MRLKIGAAIRPLNECVASIQYIPKYDITRIVSSMTQRWAITGKVIPQPVTSQSMMTQYLETLKNDFSQQYVDLVFLEDDQNIPTAFALYASQCLSGPIIVDSAFPNANDNIYATGVSYAITYEAEVPVQASGALLEFTEEIEEDPGGPEWVYAGGAINYPERQLGTQHRTYRYTQSGSAVGLLAYPRVPPPIWPFALKRQEPRISYANPRVRGQVDTEYPITWQYEYEWHLKLYGVPHRATLV